METAHRPSTARATIPSRRRMPCPPSAADRARSPVRLDRSLAAGELLVEERERAFQRKLRSGGTVDLGIHVAIECVSGAGIDIHRRIRPGLAMLLDHFGRNGL